MYATANVPDADHKHGRWALTSPTVTMTIHEIGQSPTVSGQQGSPPEQDAAAQPTSVTLALATATVSESGGTVTVTATLDASASAGSCWRVRTAASQDIDFTMPPGIFIPGGQRSGTDTISITDDDLDEADEMVVISELFDLGTTVLEDKITLTITDDDTARVTVSAASPFSVSEEATATYTVVLDSQPTADVTITASSGDADAATVSPASHTFTPSGWNTAQTFTVTGVAMPTPTTRRWRQPQRYQHGWQVCRRPGEHGIGVSIRHHHAAPQQQNRAPTVANAIADATIVNESGTQSVSLSGVFSDADSDALTVTAASSDTDKATVSVAADYSGLAVTNKAQGTAARLPIPSL